MACHSVTFQKDKAPDEIKVLARHRIACSVGRQHATKSTQGGSPQPQTAATRAAALLWSSEWV
jgi:hypothetical protein